MIFVCCIDKKDGLQFNHRRQSRDRLLIEDLLREADGRKILIAPESALLFPAGAQVSEAPDAAGEGEIYFYEGFSPLPDPGKIERAIVYHWNRAYPGDLFFDNSLLSGMKRVSKTDFAGSSHEKITKEVYVK